MIKPEEFEVNIRITNISFRDVMFKTLAIILRKIMALDFLCLT